MTQMERYFITSWLRENLDKYDERIGWTKDEFISNLFEALPISPKVDNYVWEEKGKWKMSIIIGDEYYETAFYDDKQYALAEIKGWWDGIKIQVEEFIKKAEDEERNNKTTATGSQNT